jgi:nucleotidyltransferase substrate binding protein (TIGR01987 family)
MYGLSVRQWRQIFAILSRYGKRINWVKLFGSRARGDYKPVSDVDLAIASTENLVTPLQLDFDQSQLPFTFDLIDYRRQPNQKLKDAIDREGKLLWAVDGKGEWMMTKEQLRLKWEDYHKALHRLEIALSKTLDEDDLYLDATIQRFEFTFELAWKLMKAVLEYEGIEATSPRSSIREAWKQHLIGDAEKWLDMQVKRNLSSHTYNEETAQDIYRHIKEDYVDLLQDLDQEIRSRLDI